MTAGPRAKDKLQLWFFRDLSDEQRLKLFGIFGLPTDEIGKTHGHQRHALRHVLETISGQGDPIAHLRDVGSAEDPCYVPCAVGDPGGFPVYGEPS